MVMQDWLEPVLLSGGRGYRATSRAIRRLDEAADRIYRRTDPSWDGTGTSPSSTRPRRAVPATGCAPTSGSWGTPSWPTDVWVSPFPRNELASVVEHAGVGVRTARADRFDPPPTSAWDLDALRIAYEDWLATADDLIAAQTAGHDDADEAAFAARFHLVHEWRKFLFADPGLPDELLPGNWPGRAAAELFAGEATRLKPGADRFVVRCLDGG